MANFTFEDGTFFDLENDEVLIFSLSSKAGGDQMIHKKSYPTGFMSWLKNKATLGIWGSKRTRAWAVNTAITSKRFVTVPINYEAFREKVSEMKFGGFLNKFYNKTPKNMAIESYYYPDIENADYIEEDDQSTAMFQARFALNLNQKDGYAHEFTITTKKDRKQATAILKALYKDVKAKANEMWADAMKTWSLQANQSSYDAGNKSFAAAQADYNRDVAFYNSLKEGAKRTDLSNEDHVKICCYLIAFINGCVERTKSYK